MYQVCVFAREMGNSHDLGSGLQFPAQLVAGLVYSWRQPLGPHVGSIEKLDIIDYFLVTTHIRPLIQKRDVVKSVSWCPHYGVRLVLNVDSRIDARMHSKKDRLMEQTQQADPVTLGRSKTQVCLPRQDRIRCQD